MEAATSTLQHPFGLGPQGPGAPHGAQQAQGPRQPAPAPPGAPRPEEQQQQHHKPFFYIQPSQPYLPMQGLQWPVPLPMPVSYNPYYGYPGLGYGMPMMPHYQPNPYVEPPGFVVPHTHLHLMDYRRMLNPQYYQTMAYHSRRFRYQHSGPAREMTSSQVQTEPLAATRRASGDAEASSGLPLCSSSSSSDAPSAPAGQPLPPPSAAQTGDRGALEPRDAAPPSSAARTPPNGSFVIQTEEVRIECCATPVGLQLLHAREAAGMSHGYSQDVVQCSSILQGGVLRDDGLRLPADQSQQQALQACPDILMVGTPGEKLSAPTESGDPVSDVSVVGSQVGACSDAEEARGEREPSATSKNFHFKVVHLPFDPKYLDELRRMESAVWSAEETLIPSPESPMQSGCTDAHDETPAAVADSPTEEAAPAMPPLTEDEPEDAAPAAADETASGADAMDVAEDAPAADVDLAHALLLLDDSTPPVGGGGGGGGGQHTGGVNLQDHQDTSFESLPAYLPSTSWLADFDGVHCCGEMPPTPRKQSKAPSGCGLDVPARRRKLEYKEQSAVGKPKERYKPKGKADRRSLSDHECCLSRNFSEDAFAQHPSKRERLCSRCLAKRRGRASPGPPGADGRSLKRKAAPFQQRNDDAPPPPPPPTCEACRSHARKLMRRGSGPDVRGPHRRHDTEGDSSENGSGARRGPKWRPADPKRPLASKQNLERRPAAAATTTTTTHPKLRDVCNEPQRPHQHPHPWERPRHCPHGNAIREMDENCAAPFSPQTEAWRRADQIHLTHRWQSEKSWRAAMSDADGSRNEARSQHLNKHNKKSQSQGTHRKDTRC